MLFSIWNRWMFCLVAIRLGPLFMSLITEISPHSYFLCKNFDVFTWEGDQPFFTEILVVETEISATGIKISHMNTPAWFLGWHVLEKIASLSQLGGQNGNILPCMYFHYKSIKFASLVTSVDKATIVANDASLWVAILFSSLKFYPG